MIAVGDITRYFVARISVRYVLPMADDEPNTEELKLTQLERERAERKRAENVPEDEAAQHERRAEKARYLAEKLEERAESEREPGD